MKTKIVVLTGAGVSAESGVSTFRDSNGLWEQHKVEDVASIEGWYRDPALVLDFYNARRAQLATVKPNDAHRAIAELEKEYDILFIGIEPEIMDLSFELSPKIKESSNMLIELLFDKILDI